MIVRIILTIVFFMAAAPAWSASCTDGVDCYCDIYGVGGSSPDANILMCEDFEDPAYYEDVAGSWWRNTGGGRRGTASTWRANYATAVRGCGWADGTPVSPKLGITCDNPGQNCVTGEWVSAAQGGGTEDLWDANSDACIDMIRAGDFDANIETLDDPVIPGGGSGVFDGNTSMAYMVHAGRTAGILGTATWAAPSSELGITMAFAYSSNMVNIESNLFETTTGFSIAWKSDEFLTSGGILENTWTGNVGAGGLTLDPFRPALRFDGNEATRVANCATLRAGVTIFEGQQKTCDVSGLAWRLSPTIDDYDQATDFPHGTWGCLRGHWAGLGTTSGTYKIWFNDTLLIHIEDINTTFLTNAGGVGKYDQFKWNAYSNRNQGGVAPTTVDAYRYHDNYHIREGAPVSCEQIGFGAAGPTATPTASPTTTATPTATAPPTASPDAPTGVLP